MTTVFVAWLGLILLFGLGKLGWLPVRKEAFASGAWGLLILSGLVWQVASKSIWGHYRRRTERGAQ